MHACMYIHVYMYMYIDCRSFSQEYYIMYVMFRSKQDTLIIHVYVCVPEIRTPH